MTGNNVYMPLVAPPDANALTAIRKKIPLSALGPSLATELPEV